MTILKRLDTFHVIPTMRTVAPPPQKVGLYVSKTCGNNETDVFMIFPVLRVTFLLENLEIRLFITMYTV